MLNWLEQFSAANQHTIAALGAISTFAAVVVSLVLASIAQRSSRTRIRASATVSLILHSTLKEKPKPEYITVEITNVGLMPAMIPFSFFHWKMPFSRGYWMVNPWDSAQHDPWVPMRTYPAEIRPRASATFFLSEIDVFRSTMAEKLQEVRHLRWRARFIKAIVRTDDGKLFKVKLDKPIQRELAKARRTAKALDHL
jgi:hypothetical protein